MKGSHRAAGAVCKAASLFLAAAILGGCRGPAQYRENADEVAHSIIDQKQEEALGRTEPFTIEKPADALRWRLLGDQDLPVSGAASYGSERLEPPEHDPEPDYPQLAEGEVPGPDAEELEGPVRLDLVDALQVGAQNSRSYQRQKEAVFRAALDLDLEIDQFRNTYQGLIEGIFSSDQAGDPTTGVEATGEVGVTRRLKSGAALSSRLIVDLARLLSNSGASSVGLAADASITIPLLQGAGRHIVTEPLTQAERNVIYAIWDFERFKREFAVDVVRQYFSVLQGRDQVENAANSYRNQVAATRRTQANIENNREGFRQEDLDQARQQELSSRNRWISAEQRLENSLDQLKIQLGLPTDARIEVDPDELARLEETTRERLEIDIGEFGADIGVEEVPHADAPVELERPDPTGAGPYELEERRAIEIALENRLDLKTSQESVYDSQRRVVIAADALKPGLDLVADASIGERRSLGSAGLPNAELRPDEGFYSAGFLLDLPFERTAERNAYRESYIGLEEAVRNVQALEDEVKQSVRLGLRGLLEQRESYKIQLVAERVARRRVDRTQAMLENARDVSTRDVNEAQSDLLEAQNQVTGALIDYRISELALQRDMGVLEVDHQGLFQEFDPYERDSS